MSDDGFGPDPGRQPGDAPKGVRDGMARPAGPDQPASALAGFLSDGLPGLIAALDTRGASFEDDVEDPEALRAAEAAAMRGADGSWSGVAGGKPRITEAWSVVATQMSPTDHSGLDDVARLLESDGIDFGWDPMDPREAVNFTPPASGLFAGKLVSIVVPASQVGPARQSLYGQPPQGVSYPWSDAAAPLFGAEDTTSTAGDRVWDASTGRATPVTHGDPRISDNARLAGLAGGGMSVARVIGVVFILIALAGMLLTIASFWFARG